MKKYAIPVLLPVAFLLFIAQPGFSVSKETIQMMTQLDSLQQAVQILQRTVDTQTAVLKTLVQQTSDNVDSMKAVITKMQNVEQQNLAATSNRFDAMTGQIQQLSASLDETKGQLSKLSDQLAQTQKIMQTLNAPATPGAAGATESAADAPGQSQPGAQLGAQAGAQTAAPALPPVPDPQTLYKSAYADYTQGQYQLAVQGFQQYLQDYGDTDLASNAQFYVGDSYYAQKDYKSAIREYDRCIKLYPHGNKAAAAHLKKAYALLALGQRTAGEHELSLLLRMYPNSHEADLAQERLRKLRLQARARR
ncbi:MAG: tetratricopeptide repeat protein [Terriglobia bacterium]